MFARAGSIHDVSARLHRFLGASTDGYAPSFTMELWLAQSLSRRVVLLLIALAVAAALHAAGIAMPASVYGLLVAWLLVSIVAVVRLRAPIPVRWLWRAHMAAQVLDVFGVVALTHFLGATLWFAPLMLAMSVSLGGQTLPRLNGLLVALIASASYGIVVFAQVRGVWPLRGVFAPVSLPSEAAAAGAVVMVSVVLVAIAAIQRGYYRHVAMVEQRHARLLETARDMIVVVDRHGRYLSANAAVEEQLGWSPEHILGDTVFDSIDEADRAKAEQAFGAVLRGATTLIDLRIRTADESRRLLSTTGAPILDENGRVVAVLFIARDVTAERERERQLAQNERNLRLIVRSVNETVFTIDRTMRFTAVYGRWGPNAPMAPSDLVGRTIREVLGETAGEAMEGPVRRAIQGETVEIEHELPTAAQPRNYRLLFTPLRDGDVSIVGATGVAYDVTAQRQAERERDALQSRLEESRRIEAIGRLVSGVAHELNNPLTAILTFAEQLRAEPRSPGDAAALATIHGQAVRSRAIVRDLLTFVRPGQNRPKGRLDAGPVVGGAVRALEPHVSFMGVKLVFADQTGAWVDGEASGIEQAVTNLVLNAAHAAGAGGVVTVTVTVTEQECIIAVEDTGPGIAEAALPLLFEPFFTTKPIGQGTGLGLFVSLGIAQHHGGTLRAMNRPPSAGGGARFEFRLPRAAPPVESSARKTPPRSSAAIGVRPRVLIVDDEQAIRVSLRRYFDRREWDVSEAADGAEALEVISREGERAFAMILCDLRMPGMNGAELHGILESRYPAALERMVFASGDLVSPEAVSLIKATRCRILEKPFELAALGALADELVAGVGEGASDQPNGEE